LQAVAAGAVDVLYLLTGEYASPELPADEHELLVGYRKLDVGAKARVLGVVEGVIDTPNDSAMTAEKRHV